jgi:hypothetical protein
MLLGGLFRRELGAREAATLACVASFAFGSLAFGSLAFGVLAVGLNGCGGSSHTPPGVGTSNDGGAGAGDAQTKPDASDAKSDAATCSDALTKKSNGAACTCASDCTSNVCVDGLCCNMACDDSCKTCSAQGSMGTCTFLSAGTKPRDPATCAVAATSTCGFDGTCDGAGACRRYISGTFCGAGTCTDGSVVGARSCDGAGRCRQGPAVICAPYQCNGDTGACYDSCTQSSQCVSGNACVSASCGQKMKGATCKANADCESGFCADNVCCNVACQGGCVSCGLPGRLGTCWPIDAKLPDPRGVCKDQGAPSCGTTGACDGFGSCEKYAAETQCLPPSCTGTRRNTPGTCDGNGTCRPQGVQNCSPFLCVDAACNKVCVTDKDCETGHACVKGLCGPKQNGQPCSAGTECSSSHCVDGVCCDTACAGACRSCGLPSSPGKCTSIAAGNGDPRGLCLDMMPAQCASNGKCDGAGGCQKYKVGTICAAESCDSNVYKPSSACNATGQCTEPDSLPCSPYVCNGSACFGACTTDTNCLTPNSCNGNSCGKKNIGASCSAAVECQSNFCAQGVCCDKACNGACQSCAMSGTLGTCTSVPTGNSDPAGLCTDMTGPTCGTNGKCQAGACQKYAKGTACAGSTCPAATTTFTPASTCDGSGACVTPAASSCFPFKCGASVCKGACAADADCASPAVCISGSCGLKGLGKTCADNTECLSKFCAQGVCCNSSCNGSCESCGLAGSMGACTNVANGATDPQGTCQSQGSATCGTDGRCDGKGSCRLYVAGTECVAPSCPAGGSTLTQTRTCDGAGNCQAPATLACAPYKCNGVAACNAACTADTDCLPPNICDPQTNLCGNKKRLGQTCAATSDCLTGDFCVDGVCCGASLCGLCQACNVPGKAGSCANVVSGDLDPHARCAATPPCGNTGSCNGLGACEQASPSTACGVAACSVSTYTPVSHCTGAGACAVPTPSPCSPYICGSGVCKTTCTGDGDCVSPYTCQGTAGSQSCALKKNGLVCATGAQCISGSCVDGVCCGSTSCPACTACNLSGVGTCTPVAAGTAAPASFCADEGAASCGKNAKCDGLGGCQKYPDGSSCAAASCPASSTTLIQAGTCQGGTCSKPPHSCAPYVCDGVGACTTSCGSCSTGYYCTGPGGSCVPLKNLGATCASTDQCAAGSFCVDGVCCGTSSCASCQACNVAGSAGTCSPMLAGVVDPDGTCTDQGASTCGTNGKCNGAGGCQKYPDATTCSSAACQSDGVTLTLAGACSGGSCLAGMKACAPFVCSAGACTNTCNVDGDCASGTYCSGPGGQCTANIKTGDACDPAFPKHCALGNCVDGVCCDTACTGACVTCSLGPTKGICSNVMAGVTDPRHVCADLHAAACSTNGACDGSGACQTYPAATMCSSASCPAHTALLQPAGTCATGTCAAPPQTCPDHFMCDGASSCLTACGGDGDCVPGYFCSGAACVAQKDQGTGCTNDDECGSGHSHCVDHVCCSSGACGQCQSCGLPGSLGTCTNVDQHAVDPTAMCPNLGAATCQTNGRCNADGSCELYDGSTMCADVACTSMTEQTSARFCDGGGNCGAGTVTDCGAYTCDATTNACFTSCTDNECSIGYTCDPASASCM